MRTLFVVLSLLVLLVASCRSDDEAPANPPRMGTAIELPGLEYFVFGTYTSNCGGDCATLFRWVSDTVQRDVVSGWKPGDALIFADTVYGERDPSVFQSFWQNEYEEAVVQLINDFPPLLLEDEREVYGCPDCDGQGGYYLELKTATVARSWQLDTRNVNMPEPINAYKLRIWEVTDQLLNN